MSLTPAHLLANAKTDLSFQRTLYEDLHEHPELSGLERATSQKILGRLENLDCEIVQPIGGFGIVGVFRNGPGPTALFRADFDALPVKETTGVPYASTRVQARPDGSTVPVMHACGHDMHTTALLGACELLDDNRDSWSGTFLALFQPSEEIGTGADAMLADGLARRIPAPDVCFGQHIMPHKAVDPTYVAAMIIIRLQGLVGREVDPNDFAVISVGKVRAGTTNNIIPDTAELTLNCRFYDDTVKRRVYSGIRRVVHAECEASGCPEPPRFEYFSHAELTDNSKEVFERVRPVFDAVFGPDSVDAERSTVSEDFSHIPRAFGAPYLFWLVGCTPREQWDAAVHGGTVDTDVPVNHMSTFLPDYEPTVSSATRAAAAAVLTYLGNHN